MKLHIKALCLSLLIALTPFAASAADDVYTTTTQEQSFADVVTAIENGIINQGLKIDYHGFIGDMLKRTAADVGANKVLYSDAEFFTFCSAVMSRNVMEAEITDIAYCPYVIFVYEAADTPNTVTIGFRQLPEGGERKSVNMLLREIVDSAAEGF